MPRTREQDREYQRTYRAKTAAAAAEPAVSQLVESAVDLVRQELDSLPQAAPLASLRAAALAMAAVLDNPSAVPQHPAAAGQLRQIMAEVRAAPAPAVVSKLSMIRGGRAAG